MAFFLSPIGKNLWACVCRQKGTNKKNKDIEEEKYGRSENRHMDTEKRYGKDDSSVQSKGRRYGQRSKYLDVYKRVRCGDYRFNSDTPLFNYSVMR